MTLMKGLISFQQIPDLENHPENSGPVNIPTGLEDKLTTFSSGENGLGLYQT